MTFRLWSIRSCGAWLRSAVLWAFCLVTLSLAQAATQVSVGVLQLEGDARHDARTMEKSYPHHPSGDVAPALKVALDDSQFELEGAGVQIKLQSVKVKSLSELFSTTRKLAAQGMRYFLLDLPAPYIAGLAAFSQKVAEPSSPWVLINIAEPHDFLRASYCTQNLLHSYPSEAMQFDALGQYLVSHKWKKILLLVSKLADDQERGRAFESTVRKYGLQLVAKRVFLVSGDPRERELANPLLLTGDADYDSIVVLDSVGEFARSLPYNTQLPRPVLGDGGLSALAWHAQWERNGGPQLSRRINKVKQTRVDAHDWAAWAGLRSLVAAFAEKPKGSSADILQVLKSGAATVDGFKGPVMSYRAWDGQLRQPLLLAHADGVIASAPLDGFLHPTDTLDTLGVDAAQSGCKPR